MASGTAMTIGEARRARRSPAFVLIPGLRDLVTGRRPLGLFTLAVLVLLLSVLVFSADEMAEGLRSRTAGVWVATVTLFGSLAFLWGREIRAFLRKTPVVVKHEQASPWSITIQQFKKNRMALIGLSCMPQSSQVPAVSRRTCA